jgi:hypothetical protein
MRSSEVKTQIQTSHSESQKIETKLHKCFYGNMYMGNSHSHPRWECHAWAAERNFSIEHKISAWDELEPKNIEYYDGTRFFTVPLHLYPSCESDQK